MKIKPEQGKEEGMKIRPGRPSPAMAVALLALFLAVGGNVVAYGLGRNSVHSRDIAPRAVRASDLGSLRIRSGSIVDPDPIAHDGIYTGAGGRAHDLIESFASPGQAPWPPGRAVLGIARSEGAREKGVTRA
jgi:ABC-type cobalt transport system substrate-binding protein